jgi:hypothetical protein
VRKILLFIGLLQVCLSFSQSLNLNLTACYAFNTNALEPINSLTGTLSAASLTADRFTYAGSAYSLNGTAASYIELPDNALIKPVNDITFSAWVKPATLANAQLLFTKNSTTVNIQAYQLAIVIPIEFKF